MNDKIKQYVNPHTLALGALVAATAAGAQTTGGTTGGFDIGAGQIAAVAATTILGIAAAGAGLKATGIGVKVAFKWAERLLKG